MKINSRFTEQMEFFTSLFVFENKALAKKVDLGIKWRSEVAKDLPDEFIKTLEDQEVSTTLTWIHRCVQLGLTGGETVDDLLEWVNQDNPVKFPVHSQLFPETPPLSMKDIRPILATWNDVYFSKLDPSILVGLKLKQKELEKLIERELPVDVINKATNGLTLENQSKVLEVTLTPQYHARPVVLYHYEEEAHFYQYATDEIKGANQSIPPITMRLPQALSDENRLKILKLIATGPQTFKSIHQHMALAKSTVHHHMITLRAAGLVHLHISPDKADYYTFRERGLKELEARMLQYIYDSKNP